MVLSDVADEARFMTESKRGKPMKSIMALWAVAVFVFLGFARPAGADEWRYRLEAVTDFPVSAGIGGLVESPGRLRVSTSLGYLPPVYLNAVNSIAVELDAYSENIADLIETAFDNSLVWRTQVGWRPWENKGFYFGGGFTLIGLGGGVTAGELLTGLTDVEPPEGLDITGRGYDVSTLVSTVDIEVGWEFALAEHWTLRTALGTALAVASNSNVEPNFEPRLPRLQQALTNQVGAELDDTYEQYIKAPLITLAVGYEF